jgi:hypothetical protein
MFEHLVLSLLKPEGSLPGRIMCGMLTAHARLTREMIVSFTFAIYGACYFDCR